MIQAKILRSTYIKSGPAVHTFQLIYPLFIHAELMTHRVFSRNCASARAIPSARMIELAKEHSTAPPVFASNKAGMQPGAILPEGQNSQAHKIWDAQMLSACDAVERLTDPKGLNVHKQWANRLLMPFTHMCATFTGTDFVNFFDLRLPDETGQTAAQEEIAMLSGHMKSAIENTDKSYGKVHIPYVDFNINSETNYLESIPFITALIRSIAKTARQSFMRTDRVTTIAEDAQMVMRLRHDGKLHASCFEHIAFDRDWYRKYIGKGGSSSDAGSGNFNNKVVQLRHCKVLMDRIFYAASLITNSVPSVEGTK